MKAKKLVFAMLALGVIVGFTSCKKNYTCTCTVAGGSIAIEYEKVKKADAEDACSSAETTYKVADPGASCSLKKS